MAKPECRTAGYKLLGDYVFSEIIPELINDSRWDIVGTSAKAARSALQLSRQEGFISSEQLQTLEADLSLLESAAEKKDEKPTRQAFYSFFKDYGTTIIDAIAE
ncbi:unnamed protein product, partial [marine sediment metagenome]